ncbi:MAG: lytic transglycosylase domain-containing protein [Clostridia bacterium]|nr:lytic transglycosylase domain-containing protein [Clostridia bacterium]
MNKSLRKSSRAIWGIFFIFIAIVLLIDNSTTILRFNYPLKYKEYVYKYSAQNNLDPYLVFSIIKAESSFDPNAISHKNARGLMQISEGTGKWVAMEKLKLENYTHDLLYNPELNIKIGCWYLKWLKKAFNNDISLILAAYNGGSGNVSEWLKDPNLSRTGKNLERIPFKETDRYVKNVKNNYFAYKKLYENRF